MKFNPLKSLVRVLLFLSSSSIKRNFSFIYYQSYPYLGTSAVILLLYLFELWTDLFFYHYWCNSFVSPGRWFVLIQVWRFPSKPFILIFFLCFFIFRMSLWGNEAYFFLSLLSMLLVEGFFFFFIFRISPCFRSFFANWEAKAFSTFSHCNWWRDFRNCCCARIV